MTPFAERAAFIGSSNPGSAQYALTELRQLFSDLRFSYLDVGEVFLFETATATEDALQIVSGREPIFLRHLQPVDQVLPLDRTWADLARIAALAAGERRLSAGETVAVRVRLQGGQPFAYTAAQVRSAIEAALVRTFAIEAVRREADWTVAVYLAANRLYWGLTRPGDDLSDWPGGMVRFQKEQGQISRAAFKLLEAEERFRLDLGRFRRALDIGAAPGGWTALLLDRGLEVTAIDPAALHPTLLGHPRLRYLATSAATARLGAQTFDLLVCDMNWDARRMAKLVAGLLPVLVAGGAAIVTVKLLYKKPFQTLKDVLVILGEKIELVRAKQLFHNREELTLYLRKHPEPSGSDGGGQDLTLYPDVSATGTVVDEQQVGKLDVVVVDQPVEPDDSR
ncbi:RNA 2'-O-ribose methyltransferase [Gloeobacter kilaueensis JS1]|uniref:RNA 2'-O-ribose methyltransferase n=1 Tax=Gloeobacter kilaueensis (strain ATCC BAA-2537 / CCAP 1431/1 / ULC 316 / JS1) TaxID=1183438 RepID=U5QKS4_GLOK1|nr:RNA 2'-O-ribose methyltransferase [Gloeobacter kilaueensis JS1]